MYPAIEKEGGPPLDDDLINDRMNDIRFHDKTKYDEKVAHMTSDYIDMARELLGIMNTARNKIMEQKKTNQIKNNLLVELENLLDIDEVLECLLRLFPVMLRREHIENFSKADSMLRYIG